MSQYTTAANRINHKGTPTETSIFYSLAIQALSVPHTSEILREVDALVAWPGIVLDAAPRHAVLDWNNGIGKRHLLVAGYHEQDVAEEKFSLSKMEETLGLRRQHGVHTQIHAGHAGQQAT